jgi:tocopherol O-methyltransferase
VKSTGAAGADLTEAVREHYDRLSFLYRALWGEHIHHGFWEDAESPARAQLKLVERLAAYARVPRGARVLDVGCGIGGPAVWLARELDCRVTGVTISPVQARLAGERARAAGVSSRVRFEVCDANDLRPAAGAFDVVWVVECSEHLADKARFVEACARALRPGGALALCAWLAAERPHPEEHARLVESVCRGMLCPGLACMSDYARWMRAAGFSGVEAEDVTRRVEGTWARCAEIASRAEVRALAAVSGERVRSFLESFAAIKLAYEVGAMAYGMFRAVKG